MHTDEPGDNKLSGGSNGYYSVWVDKPTSGRPGYVAECNDIIEALGLSYAEGNVLKAVWRIAAARMANGKPGHNELYDAEKIVFFGERLVVKAKE